MKKTLMFMTGLLLIGLLQTGCLQGLRQTAGDPPPEIKVLNILQRQFENRNVSGFLKRVHSDYDDGKFNRNDLRNQLSEVYDQYSQIDLEFYGQRKTRSDGSTVIVAYWNLRWTCTVSGPGCPSSGEVVLRKGNTTFVFEKESEQSEKLQLVVQRNIRLFGSAQPGKVHR